MLVFDQKTFARIALVALNQEERRVPARAPNMFFSAAGFELQFFRNPMANYTRPTQRFDDLAVIISTHFSRKTSFALFLSFLLDSA